MTTDSVAQQITPDTPAWRRWRLARGLDQYDTDAGPLLTNLSRRERRAPGRAGAPARAGEPGRGLVNAGMALLGLLDAGLLYVVYAAQYAFIFSQKHEHTAAQVQALALDAAMIIFSVLALGLARKGLGAPAERAAIVACAAASAFMNWTAADQASLRSVAVYVAAPILLALTTDRTISVVRRHVLGMKDDASPWARLGRALARVVAVRAPRRGGLQGHPARCEGRHPGRRAAARGRAARPGRGCPGRPAGRAGGDPGRGGHVRAVLRLASWGRLRELAEATAERQGRLELAAGASTYPTKKAHLLALYRAHGDYGRREAAGRVAGELAGPAGLQAGTARAYIYEELSRLASQGKEDQ